MIKRHKLLKTTLIIIILIIIVVVLSILFISPITKYLIEKYDEKYTGRQITMDWAYVNVFSGAVYFSNFKIMEEKSDSIFFSSKGVGFNIALLKLLSKNIEISNFKLNQPKAYVIQNKKVFNFDDMVKKFEPDKKDKTPSKFQFNILGVRIESGEIHYREKQLPLNISIKDVNIESPGKRWDSDSISTHFSFKSGSLSGEMKGNFSMNVSNKNYRVDVKVNKLDLKLFEPYLKSMKNYGTYSGKLEANLLAIGNFTDAKKVVFSGLFSILNFHFGKNQKEDYGSFDKLSLGILELSPKNHKYLFDSVSLIHPYFSYERYDEVSNNLQKMFKEKGASDSGTFNLVITIGKYISELSRNFFKSSYKINRLEMYKANLVYNDYSLSEKFHIELNPLSISADSINKNYNRVNIAFKSAFKPYGNSTLNISINPRDSSEFDMQYHFQRFPVSMFNPYLITYTSYPMDRGTIELKGNWKVRNGILNSSNHILIVDPRVARRVKNKDTRWLPMWLAMAFVREQGNVIDYQIPITGNLRSPKFHIKDVIFKVLTNIIVKPARTVYRINVKNTENEIEKSLTLNWDIRHSTLNGVQDKFTKKMSDFLAKNHDATIIVYPQLYAQKEKEYILLYEAKKKYYAYLHRSELHAFNNKDSSEIDKMSIKDKSFIQYLNKHIKGGMLFSVQSKCAKLIGSRVVNDELKLLLKERENRFMLHFKQKKVDNRVKIVKEKDVVPYNGFSFYKIAYTGEYPKDLLKAYDQMNQFNNEDPRKEFKNERKKGSKP